MAGLASSLIVTKHGAISPVTPPFQLNSPASADLLLSIFLRRSALRAGLTS